MGRKVTVYGYQFKNGILQADKEQSRFVQEIFNVYNSGISVSRLKDHIEGLEINPVKLNDMLSDKRYMGDENFPKIIEPELFEAVQQMKKERRKAIGKEQSYIYYKEYFLLGISFWLHSMVNFDLPIYRSLTISLNICIRLYG